jgi:glutathione synthase/RimK-type ligase-like ATP-grasp enzyme
VSRYVLTGVWRSLAAEWLPAEPHAAAAADNKLTALTAAQAAGLDVPPTVVTNRPADLSRAWRDLDDDVVAKTPTFVAVTLDGRPRHLFTSHVTRRDLLRRRAVGYAPVILQRRIPKAVELRVTVVGQQCFAAEIHGQGSSRARQDWRRSYGHGLRYGVHQLPEHVEEGCRRVAAALGLSFGAIDLILTPDGRYVFLEINAGGQWGWIEEETGLPIAAAVADWILVRLEGKHG